jgi:hypothetical protein
MPNGGNGSINGNSALVFEIGRDSLDVVGGGLQSVLDLPISVVRDWVLRRGITVWRFIGGETLSQRRGLVTRAERKQTYKRKDFVCYLLNKCPLNT